ncbi:MAG TPA: hypothetical protein VL093_07840 [Flavipsychrobacter sp.]|jgi:hypothetical protein|nr:hypothetical protein [Flavipsychrobacter sp.]
MKRIIFCLAFAGLMSCTKEDGNRRLCSEPDNSILLLRIDYLTYSFEGGATVNLTGPTATGDSLPIHIDFREPGDFGNLSLYYQPTGDTLFNGDIIWMGKGDIAFPQSFTAASNYPVIPAAVPMPDTNRFQKIYGASGLNYASLWAAIDKLQATSCYLDEGKRIGVFLYTPSVGIGDPAEWDWFVVMSK